MNVFLKLKFILLLFFHLIDNLIFDPKIFFWIDLEFYFESYEFYNFGEFFGIYLNLFSSFKIKKVFIYRELMWRSVATWRLITCKYIIINVN